MGGSRKKNGRRKDPKKVSYWKIAQQKSVRTPRARWADVVQRDALQILRIHVRNGDAFGGRPQLRRGCSAMHESMDFETGS
jgi:hypothetical protein